MATAIRATETLASNSRTSEERNVIRSVAIRRRRYRSVTSWITPTWARERPKIFRVVRPLTTSRKCPDSTWRARNCRSVRTGSPSRPAP